MKGIRERWYAGILQRALKVLPVTVVTGARQTGKTTLVQMLNAHGQRNYLTLDDLGVLDQAQRDPNSLLANRPITLDEVQRAPELLLAVKRAVDERRNPGEFLLTGSANLLLMGRVADSLAGRALYLELPPFCPAEWCGREGALDPIESLFAPDFDQKAWPQAKGDWKRALLKGGFPPALEIEDDADRGLWFAGYVQTYLERDLRQLSDVASLTDFQRLMFLTAHRTCKVVNQADLARDAGLSHPTAHRYLNLLQTGCLISRIHPLTPNPSSAVVKAPKLVWSDCGLAAWLAGIHNPKDLDQRLGSGFWLEQTLYQTFQSWRALDPANRRVHYWRDRAGREVDFILEQNRKLVAIEIKEGSQVGLSDAAGIHAFRSALGKGRLFVRGVVLHAGQTRSLDQDIVALPWGWMVEEDENPKTER